MDNCPNCLAYGHTLVHKGPQLHCRSCHWTGNVYPYHPQGYDTTPAEPAGMDHAICATHPTKRAIATCAGSGDYICSLCRVRIDGKDYSVHYVDRAVNDKKSPLVINTLNRPDRMVRNMLILSVFLFPLSLVFFVISFLNVNKVNQLRVENPLFAEVVSPRYRFQWALNGVIAVSTVVGTAAFFIFR